MQKKNTIKYLTAAAVIAAMYCALTLLLPFMTFGPVQCRLSEALTILPVFTPAAVPGLIVGCLISNVVGLSLGANVAGAWDILLGTLATALAAVMTRGLRHIRVKNLPLLATLPPVILNGVIIGGELTVALYSEFSVGILLFNMLTVAAGQLIACCGGGLLLFSAVDRSTLFIDRS